MWCFMLLAPRVALLTCWVGLGGSSLSLEGLSHQMAGLYAALPNPQALTCQEGRSGSAAREGGARTRPAYNLALCVITLVNPLCAAACG